MTDTHDAPEVRGLSMSDLGALADTLVKKKEEARAARAVLFGVGGTGVSTRIDFSITKNPDFAKSIVSTLSDIIGGYTATRYHDLYPITLLSRYHDKIKEELADEGYGEDHDEVKEYDRVITDYQVERRTQLAENFARGLCEYEDLGLYFVEGSRVVGYYGSQLMGGVVVKVERIITFKADYQQITVATYHNFNGVVEDGRAHLYVFAYDALQPVASLSVKMLGEEAHAVLSARGAKFKRFCTAASYAQYVGQITQTRWSGDKNYRADGRVMLDARSMASIAGDVHQNERYASNIDNDGSSSSRKTGPKTEATVSDDELWRTYPYLYGFSFSAKQWGRLTVDGLSEINWRDDAFDKLVLDKEDKELVQALVEYGSESFGDLIEGKGGGTIFLLHGPPGEGKTLTAEAIAEILHRPLYSVSVGELGTDPETLENKLREVLDIATVWNAVTLIDEADIFLEERNENDILRNAMVGVFLRLLEYHQGVLFLTTNRVKNIDTAFYSRISIALHYKGGDHAKRVRIWTNLLSAAQIEPLDPHKLADHEINGRQIKNVIRQSQTLAKARGSAINEEIVGHVVLRTTKFAETMRNAHG